MLYSVVYFVVHFSFTLCVRNWFLFCYSVYIFLFLKQCWHFIYVFGFVIACPLHTKVVRCWFSEKENNFIYITEYALIEMKVCTKNVQTQSLLCSIRAFCMLELSQKIRYHHTRLQNWSAWVFYQKKHIEVATSQWLTSLTFLVNKNKRTPFTFIVYTCLLM